MKIKFAILALEILFAVQLIAQTESKDSVPIGSPFVNIMSLVPKDRNDTIRIKFLNGMFWSIIFYDPDTAIAMAKEQLMLSRKLKWSDYEFMALSNLGYGMYQQGNYLEGLKYEFDALANAEGRKDTTDIADIHEGISEVYRDEGDLLGSLEHLFIAKRLLLSKKITGSQDSEMLKEWYIHAVPVYEKLNHLDTALDYARREMALDFELNKQILRTVVFFYLGNIHAKLANYDSSLYYYHQAIYHSKASNIKKDLIETYNSLSRFFIKSGKYDSSIHYANRALDTEKEMGFPLGKLETSRILSGLYLKMNKPDSAIKYLQLSVDTRDSMFSQDKLRRFANLEFDERMRTEEELVRQEHLVSEFRMYTLSAAVLVFIFIVSLLIRNNRHKQKAFRILQELKQETEIQKEKTEKALVELQAMQVQLIQAEKMASLGEMASGVAHEIQNPLNFIKNFSEVDADLMTELESELESGNLQNALFLAVDIKTNLEKIGQHSERADAIVKGMMQHSRSSKVRKETTDLNALVNQYLKSSYEEIWSKDKSFQCETKTDFDTTVGQMDIITQDFGRLLSNLFNNAFYTLAEKKKNLGNSFIPQLLVKTRALTGKIEISVIDNGMGIPEEIIDKVFQPFFTTKPPGYGSGLGLSLAYDIIKAHGGEIRVSSENGVGSQFTICLPV